MIVLASEDNHTQNQHLITGGMSLVSNVRGDKGSIY